MNTRTNCSSQIRGIASKLASHLADTLLHNALQRPSPACVKRTDSAFLPIRNEHGNAIGGAHRKQHAGNVGDQPVSLQHLLGHTLDAMNDGRVNLVHGHHGPGFRSLGGAECL